MVLYPKVKKHKQNTKTPLLLLLFVMHKAAKTKRGAKITTSVI